MDMMDPKSSLSNKPIVGMVVIVVVALFAGGWLYVDSARGDLELQIAALSSQVEGLKAELKASKTPQARQELTGSQTAFATDGWQTVTSLDGSYQLDLPPDAKLSEGASVKELAYVLPANPDPQKGDSLPYMSIRIVPITAVGQFDGQQGVLVKGTDKAYWLSLWEEMAWKPFDQVAASFKVL